MDPKDQRNETLSDNALEQDLQSIREHLAAQGDQEPPALLDQAVLNTARRELAGKRRRSMQWIGAFTTASVLVLALTLVIQLDQTPVPLDSGSADGIRLGPVSEGKSELQHKKRADRSADTTGQVTVESQAREEARKNSALPVQVAPAQREAESDFDLDNQPVASPPPAPAAPAPELSADFRDAETSQSELGQDAPAASSVPFEEDVAEGNEMNSITGQSQRGVKEKLEDTADPGQRVELHKQAVADETQQDESRSGMEDPREWVERMLKLRQDERFEQLQLELNKFKAAYPDYPLPPELADSTE